MTDHYGAVVKVDYRSLEQLLNLPKGIRIMGITEDRLTGRVELHLLDTLGSGRLPKLVEGETSPIIEPTLHYLGTFVGPDQEYQLNRWGFE